MTRDGYVIIFPTVILTILLWFGLYLTGSSFILYFAVVFTVLSVFNFWFFRDPDRNYDGDEKDIISPADGVVIKIEKVFDPDYFKKEVTLISIFLSVFNVHVNRWPVSGKIAYFDYRKGKFLAAFNHKASSENEQTLFAIDSKNGKLLFKQIAGLIARRIIYRGNPGDEVERGKRFGMIRYGSRVDLLFENAEIKVKLKQKVKCGETLIASFKADEKQ